MARRQRIDDISLADFEAGVSNLVSELRSALGEPGDGSRLIETLPRRGYRLNAQAVFELPDEESPSAAMIGRGPELARLLDVSMHCLGGHCGVAVLLAPPGMVKTTMLAAAADHLEAGAAGRLLLRATARESSSEEPYAPLLEALATLTIGDASEDFLTAARAVAPAWLAEFPGLADDNEAAQAREGLIGSGPARMAREAAALLVKLSSRAGLVLMLDDVHLCDAATMDVVRILVDSHPGAPIAVLLAMRPDPGDFADPRARRVVDALCHKAPIVRLQAWSPEEIRRYVARRTDDSVADTCASLLTARTAGNPLFARSLLDTLLERDIVAATDDGWSVDQAALSGDIALPPDLHATIAEQLKRLPEATVRLLEAAACAGPDFDVDVVARACGQGHATAERDFSELACAGRLIQRRTGHAAGADATGYQFLHETYRMLLLDRIPAGERRTLSINLARLLRDNRPESTPPLLVADLFERGGDYLQASLVRARAANAAGQRLAYREALRQVQRALELMPAADNPFTRRMTGTLELHHANFLSATHGAGSDAVDQAYGRAIELLGASDLDGMDVFRARGGLLMTKAARAEYGAAVEIGDRLVASAESHLPTLRTCAYAFRSVGKLFLGRLASVSDDLRHGLTFDADPTVPIICDVRCIAGYLLAWCEALRGRLRESDRAMTLATEERDRPSNPYQEMYGASQRCLVMVARREFAPTLLAADEVLQIGRDEGLVHFASTAVIAREWAREMSGRAPANIRRMLRAVREQSSTGEQWYSLGQLAMIAEVRLQRGDLDGAAATLREARKLLARSGERMNEPELLRLEARRHRALAEREQDGRRTRHEDRAAERLHRAIESAQSMDQSLAALRCRVDLAAIQRRRSDASAARESIGRALEALAGETSPDIRDATALLESLRAA